LAGLAVREIQWRLAREDWSPEAQPPVGVEGLERCRAMFGIDS
jgi:hypothetical protein